MSSGVAIVVEDDEMTAEMLVMTLEQSGLTVMAVSDGEDVVELVTRHRPDLVTLDLSLPREDGVEVCRRIRQVSDCYVVVLTGSQSEVDRMVSLEVGADDVMTKPFSPRELRARIAAMFRRPRTGSFGIPPDDRGPLQGGGGPEVDLERREVRLGEHAVALTRTEFDLLAHLMGNAGVVCSRPDLIGEIWNSEFVDNDHMIDVHVANLRRKLKAEADHRWIPRCAAWATGSTGCPDQAHAPACQAGLEHCPP